jgi:hypothetical protein
MTRPAALVSFDQMKRIKLTTDQAAGLLKITTAWLGQLVADGWIKKTGRNQFGLVDLVQGYGKYLASEGRRTQKSAAAVRVYDARARELELRVSREMEKLINADDAIAFQKEILEVLDREIGPVASSIENAEGRAECAKHLGAALGRLRTSFEEGWAALRAGKPLPMGE